MSFDALSLACNIITVIDFSHKFYETCRKINDSGKPDEEAQKESRELSLLANRLQQSRKGAGQTGVENDQLLRVADQCLEAAEKFQDEINKLVPAKSTSRIGRGWNSFKSATKRTWRQDRIEGLNKTMQDCRLTMQTTVLVNMHNSGLVDQAIRQAEFEKLDSRLQNFAYAISQARFDVSDLFTQNQTLHQETRTVIQRDLRIMKETQISQREQSRLKESLKFPGLNQRFNEVKLAHRDSFRWLFGDDVTESGVEYPSFIKEYTSETFGDFNDWLKLNCSSDLYWVSGKPGAGKSTLMKFLYNELQDQKNAEESYLVLRHFFWLGAANTRSRQNDIEGMFSSLLYQLLGEKGSSSVPLALTLLRQNPKLLQKDTYTDWSVEELQATTVAALELLKDQPTIYILLDALDEQLPSNDQKDLLSRIGELEALSNVRLIVSSRRERIFERTLARSRKLKLEQLTARDIYHFALDSLQQSVGSDFENDYSMSLIEDLAQLTVQKAEGVFFWARLAIDSIRRGIIDENTKGELRDRLEAMPSKLADYFQSIWQRLGDDTATYQTKAANIFSLLLCDTAAPELSVVWPLEHEDHENPWSLAYNDPKGPGLLCLALALAPEIACSIIKDTTQIPDSRLLEMCQHTQNTITSHCAGLIEFDSNSTASDPCLQFDPKYPDPNKTCRFIHRTTIDFFRETPEGKQILSMNNIGQDGPNFRTMLGFLAQSVAFRHAPHESAKCLLMRELHFGRWLDLVCPNTQVGSSFTLEQRHSLISQCHRVHYRFCGSLENPQFEGWQLTARYHSVHPFPAYTARYGLDDYTEFWVNEESKSQHLLSTQTSNAMLMGNLKGHSILIARSLGFEDNDFDARVSAFKNSIFWKSLVEPKCPADIQSPFGSADQLRLRLPSLCIADGGRGTILSISHMVLELVIALVECYADLTSSFVASKRDHAESVADLVMHLLGIFATSKNRLHDRITCKYSLKSFKGSGFPEIVCMFPDSLPRPVEPAIHDSSELPTQIVFETTPLWLIQWLVQVEMVDRPGQKLAHDMIDFLQSVIDTHQGAGKPELIEIHMLQLDGESTDSSSINFEEDPQNIADYLLEPLISWMDDIERWGSIDEIMKERFQEIVDKGRIPNLGGSIEQVYWRLPPTDEEIQRCGMACNVRICNTGSPLPVPIQPPEGASEKDMALDKITMKKEWEFLE